MSRCPSRCPSHFSLSLEVTPVTLFIARSLGPSPPPPLFATYYSCVKFYASPPQGALAWKVLYRIRHEQWSVVRPSDLGSCSRRSSCLHLRAAHRDALPDLVSTTHHHGLTSRALSFSLTLLLFCSFALPLTRPTSPTPRISCAGRDHCCAKA